MNIRNSKEIIQNILERYNFTAIYSDSCNKFGIETSKIIWKSCIENNKTSASPYLYNVIQRENEVLILRYRMAAQFSNALLRRLFPVADWFLVGIILIEILILMFAISYWFGRYVEKNLNP